MIIRDIFVSAWLRMCKRAEITTTILLLLLLLLLSLLLLLLFIFKSVLTDGFSLEFE